MTGWQYSELSEMPLDDLAYWAGQAVNYSKNTIKSVDDVLN